MAIVSISLPEDSIEALERIREHLDLSGRSEAVRTSVKIAETEIKEMEDLKGEIEGVLIVVHSTHDDRWVSVIQHKYESMIKTQLHSHLQNRKCLEVMILSSDADKLEKLMKEIYGIGKADYVKFVKSR